MSTVNVNKVVDASGGVLAPISSVMRNRIINGQMTIDQRNAGASSTNANTYTVDRWRVFGSQASKWTWQQSTVEPTGFINSLSFTSSSAYTILSTDIFLLQQPIEGLNVFDFGWGTADAKPVTLSFWTRSSLTGTFAGSIRNSGNNRSYVFTYSISSANTWEYKTVTIAGDTTGTWLTTNGIGLVLRFSISTGSNGETTAGSWQAADYYSTSGAVDLLATNGATWYVTGVQLEVGTQATSFEYRQYTTELQLCQRYFETSYPAGATIPTALANGWSSTTLQNIAEGPSGVIFKVTKRANPTMVMYNAVNAAVGAMYRASDANSITASFDYIGVNQVGLVRPSSSSANSYYLHWTASIEL
jgi:hypothetical protein